MSDNKFPAKWEKHLPSGFEDAVGTMGDEDMEETLVKCEKNIHITEKEKEDDDTINSAKTLVKDQSLKYNLYISMQKAKIRYIIHTMEGRGKVSDEVDDTLPAVDGKDGN
ncbi:hypothetical protein LCGC14_0880700 [marine sediment metagenome]|uniref:Uncharacterized protein n=1 Tax=marine sediment metagenome TaxID=412755 RepID=A0A0F9S913_9ZZZZ|nr:hypothetical protein [Candidatus Scalindua sp.]